MPELPEVETVTRRIRPVLQGRQIESAEVIDPRWCSPSASIAVERDLTGARIEKVSRRGKYMVLGLGGGLSLVMHLRMTGTVLVNPGDDPGHVRVRLHLDDGSEIAFNDPRRFGTGQLIATAAIDKWFDGRLGLEPFDSAFTTEHLFSLTRRRTVPLKGFLLNQQLIAGIGNIYADEALHRAGLHPLRRPLGLTRAEADRLRGAIIDALQAGIDAGGATIDDFRDPDGAWGAFQSEFLVHRRAGEECDVCGTEIVRFKVGGRATYCCESCQPRPSRFRKR